MSRHTFHAMRLVNVSPVPAFGGRMNFVHIFEDPAGQKYSWTTDRVNMVAAGDKLWAGFADADVDKFNYLYTLSAIIAKGPAEKDAIKIIRVEVLDSVRLDTWTIIAHVEWAMPWAPRDKDGDLFQFSMVGDPDPDDIEDACVARAQEYLTGAVGYTWREVDAFQYDVFYRQLPAR